jgi:hypothetical protein
VPELHALVGVFVYLDDLLLAIKRLKGEHLSIRNVYSPVKNAQIMEAMGTKPSGVRPVCLIAGISGGIFGLCLASFAHLRWKLITWGKPLLPWIPWAIVFFELLILVSVLSTVVAMVVKGRLPRVHYRAGGYSPKFSGDRFGIEVFGSAKDVAKAGGILKDSGAEEIHEAGF